MALGTVGAFTATLIAVHLLVQIPCGLLVDRIGAPRAALVAVLFGVLGTGLAMTAPIPAVAVTARALLGVGTGCGFIAGLALVRQAGASAVIQGLLGGLGLGAGGVAVALVPHLVGAFGWRAPYVLSLLLVVVAAVPLVLLWPTRGSLRAVAPGPRPSTLSVLRDPGVLRISWLYAVTYGLVAVVANWAAEFFQRSYGMGTESAAALAGSALLLGIVSRPLGGWILRTRPERIRAVVRGSVVLGGLATAALAIGSAPALAVIAMLVLGMAGGIGFAPVFAGAGATRPDAPGTATGAINSLGNAAVLLGTPLVGWSFSWAPSGRIAFAALVPLWALALVVLPSRRELGAADDPAATGDGGGAPAPAAPDRSAVRTSWVEDA